MNLSIFRRTPVLDEFARMREEMDRMVGRYIGESGGQFDAGLPRIEGWIPPIDVSETDEEIVIRGEMPGIAARDLEITITGTTLSIAGKKEEKEEMEQEDFYRSERRFGAFRRVLDLPEAADTERVTADSDNGVITIRVAKKPGQRAKRIEVKPTSRRVPVPG
ncbi:MAG: Hsp20/alpha crystallin family protein [bacterium]